LFACTLGIIGTFAGGMLYFVLGLPRSGQPAPIVFLVPIIFAAYLGGLWPGLITSALGAATAYLLTDELAHFPPQLGSADLFRLLMLVIEGVLISGLSEALHRSRHHARESERTYRLVAENISDVVWVLDAESLRISYVSPSVFPLRGYTAEEVLNQDITQLLTPQSLDHLRQVLEERLAAFRQGFDRTYCDGIEQGCKDGSTVWTETSTRFVRNPDTGRVEIYGNSRDITARRQAEAALHKSTERYRSLFENMLHGYNHCRVLIEDGTVTDFRVLAVNPAFLKMSGLSEQQVVGRRLSELIPGIRQTNPELFSGCARVAASGRPERSENWIPSLGRWYAVSTFSPAPGEFVAIFDDITASKQAEQALRDSEERLRLTCEAAGAGLWSWDRATGKSFWSDHIWRLFGLEPGSVEPSFEAWHSVVWPEDADYAAQILLTAVRQGRPLNGEWRVRLSDGTTRWLMARGQAVFAPDGAITGYRGINIDITARKQVEEALRDSEERFRLLVEHASDAFFLFDYDGHFLAVNQQSCESLGYSRQELLAMSIIDVEPDFDLAAARLRWDALTVGQPVTRRGVQQRKDGSRFHFEVRTTTCNIQGRRLYVALVRDVTEHEQAKHSLEQMNQLLEQRVAERTAELVASNAELESFSYSVSHDLRAPLRAIDGFSRSLVEGYAQALDATGLSYLERVTRAAERMGRLIDDLLNLSRITRAELTRVPVDVSRLVQTLFDELRRAEPDRAVELLAEPGIVLQADPRLLRILLENLLGNAFKFTTRQTPARIEFGSRTEDGHRRVCFIRDNGAGFDMNYAHKLFGPFQRLHSAREFPGTGIGLATVQRIVNRHRGRVWGEGQVGQGATFYFSLEP
jgi:PAS domain S-box-containing protein